MRPVALVVVERMQLLGDVEESPRAAGDHSREWTERDDPDSREPARRHQGQMPPPAAAELVAVPPRRHFGAHRGPDADELQPLPDARQSDVLRGHAQPRVRELSFALFDRFPSLFDRREIPALALSAHDPQSPTRRVEHEAAADREMLDHLVRAETRMAEDAGGVHREFKLHGETHGVQRNAPRMSPAAARRPENDPPNPTPSEAPDVARPPSMRRRA